MIWPPRQGSLIHKWPPKTNKKFYKLWSLNKIPPPHPPGQVTNDQLPSKEINIYFHWTEIYEVNNISISTVYYLQDFTYVLLRARRHNWSVLCVNVFCYIFFYLFLSLFNLWHWQFLDAFLAKLHLLKGLHLSLRSKLYSS